MVYSTHHITGINMFKFKKNKKEALPDEQNEGNKSGWFKRLSQGLSKTRQQFSNSIANIVLGKKAIDETLLEELETTLLLADVGIETTQEILSKLSEKVARKELNNSEVLMATLKETLLAILSPCEKALVFEAQPFVMLMVGVNGAGKTTSIAKLAHYYKERGKTIMLAAGDTFRAAAIEQLQVWGDRNDVPVVAQKNGSDSASVIFDAMQSAKSKNKDLLIADTAGRLHTQNNLMQELQKIKRVMSKQEDSAPQETLLVIDASMGQNALNQAIQFHEAIGLTGIIITKLDGTAKGGIVFAIANQLKLPIRFIGIGESVEDFKPFKAEEFIDALFS